MPNYKYNLFSLLIRVLSRFVRNSRRGKCILFSRHYRCPASPSKHPLKTRVNSRGGRHTNTNDRKWFSCSSAGEEDMGAGAAPRRDAPSIRVQHARVVVDKLKRLSGSTVRLLVIRLMSTRHIEVRSRAI